MTRSDLLALTPDTLASLANRGLVKRADKDLAAGSGPEVTTGDDGTVCGTFPDGTVTVLPPGRGLDTADCTCSAAGMCRHRVALVLAYQRGAPQQPAAAGEPLVDWSPGVFDDDALAAALGRTALTAAQRVRARGYTARVHRPTADDPAPRVELPTCTVRFPVPRALGYALTDAAAALRGEVVTLAVWAFRAADAQRTNEVSVGGRTTSPPAAADEAMRAALALADELLLDGVRQVGPVFAGSLRRAGRALAATSRHWPAGAVDELREQLDAYTARETRYTPERLALLLAELHARHRAAGHDPAGVLGTTEAPVTPLRRVRLVALGCRIGGTARDRTAETYFAHADAGIALVLRSRWDLTEGQRPTGHDLSGRRLLGSPLHALATANVVSEHTTRAADRTVTLSRGRIAATSVTPVGSAWTELPRTLLVRDTAAHLRAAGERPPRLIRPRVAADDVRVVLVDAVEEIGYDPAAQRLEAVLRDPAGNGVHLRAQYNPLCPGGLDALATALADDGIRAVSGMLGRAHGRTVLDPLAVLTAGGVTVPDLAPGAGDSLLAAAAHRSPDPVTAALRAALTALADAAHHGLCHLTPATRAALTDGADRLRRTGLNGAAGVLDDLIRTLREEGAPTAVPRWVTAQIRLTTTLDLHQEDG
ncbi:SWIM zinc finger family protein [Streptomyces capoamus]|uniref:SWIM zinc finger family protein n=1 Tax=Streptomyces capoamus TaxID=68183 RepID=UPI0033930998